MAIVPLQKTLFISAFCGSVAVYFHKSIFTGLKANMSGRSGDNIVRIKDIPTWKEKFTSDSGSLADRPVQELMEKFKLQYKDSNDELSSKVSLWEGDITKLPIDAIVNAANERLRGGGGVDGAIHRAAGKGLLAECKEYDGCKTGQSVITGGHDLPAKHVIHTVGPVGEKPELLKSAYETSLKLAVKNGLRTIAFPCISTGIYGYPQDSAAVVALGLAREYLEENPGHLDRIIFCLFLQEDVEIYEALMQVFFPVKTPSSSL